MIIKKIRYYHVKLPLKMPFQTSSSLLNERAVGILELEDENGLIGYGEVSSFETPWYTSETLASDEIVIKEMVPNIFKNRNIHSPNESNEILSVIQGHNMLKAAIETALWDLYGKQQEKSLAVMLSSLNASIDVGVAIGSHRDILQTKDEIYRFIDAGYKRFKVKVKYGKEYEVLKELRYEFPNISLMFDANGCYTEADIERLQLMDEFKLLMIEQPFSRHNWEASKALQKKINTPVCLDESIETVSDIHLASIFEACRYVNMKYSRVGGISNALSYTAKLKETNIPCWIGGMIETGISKAVTVTLASLPFYNVPGDITSSNRFFNEDVVTNEFKITNGQINVPTGNGIGVEVDLEILNYYTCYKLELTV